MEERSKEISGYLFEFLNRAFLLDTENPLD